MGAGWLIPTLSAEDLQKNGQQKRVAKFLKSAFNKIAPYSKLLKCSFSLISNLMKTKW